MRVRVPRTRCQGPSAPFTSAYYLGAGLALEICHPSTAEIRFAVAPKEGGLSLWRGGLPYFTLPAKLWKEQALSGSKLRLCLLTCRPDSSRSLQSGPCHACRGQRGHGAMRPHGASDPCVHAVVFACAHDVQKLYSMRADLERAGGCAAPARGHDGFPRVLCQLGRGRRRVDLRASHSWSPARTHYRGGAAAPCPDATFVAPA